MRPTDTVDRIATLLRERGIELQEDRGSLTGDGADARQAWEAWEAFKVMASEPAYDPFDDDSGSGHAVDHELLPFEANASDGWRRGDGTEVPAQFWLSILRQFSGGEENEGLFGPQLSIRFPLEPESPLRSLSATEFGEDLRQGPLFPPGFTATWFDQIEALDAFVVPMATRASGFSFYERQVG